MSLKVQAQRIHKVHFCPDKSLTLSALDLASVTLLYKRKTSFLNKPNLLFNEVNI